MIQDRWPEHENQIDGCRILCGSAAGVPGPPGMLVSMQRERVYNMVTCDSGRLFSLPVLWPED